MVGLGEEETLPDEAEACHLSEEEAEVRQNWEVEVEREAFQVVVDQAPSYLVEAEVLVEAVAAATEEVEGVMADDLP